MFLVNGAVARPNFTVEPTISANTNPKVPLAAILRFDTDKPVTTILTVSAGQQTQKMTFAATTYQPANGLPIIGLPPAKQYSIQVAIRDNDGNEVNSSKTLSFKTPNLPNDLNIFPPLETTTISQTRKMEAGVTLVSMRRRAPGKTPEAMKFSTRFGLLLAVNEAGKVVWYYQDNVRIADFEYLSNGHILYLTTDSRLVEIDLLGNEVKSWYSKGRPESKTKDSIEVDTMALHHHISRLSSGNILALGVESRAIDNYYTSETDRNAPRKKQDKVLGDEVLEFQPDGKVVWRWRAFEHLDPFRIGYSTFEGYWIKRGFPNTVDWTHTNAVLYDARDNSVIISMRHQDAIMKIDRASGAVKWILAENQDWSPTLEKRVLKPQAKTLLPYHQHGLMLTPQGTLLTFVNGNFHARPFQPALPPSALHSRAVEYAIDETNMTVNEVWSSDELDDGKVLSVAMGHVDWLPQTGNILVAFGGLFHQDDINNLTWEHIENFLCWTRIREYTHTHPAYLVWEIVLDNRSKEVPMEWVAFGAKRIPSLVPVQ